MGLYGPLTQDAAAGQAYTGVTYTQQRDLFFSEIDPVLHQAVATGKYGETCSNPPCTKTSTLEYQPKYFLINGDPFSVGDACIGGLAVGDSVLLRLYNTGLQELAPMMLGSHFQIVAEGGNKLPYAQTRYSVLLSPGSTKDLVFTPTQNGAYPIIERRLNLTNPTGGIPVNAPGGMQICLAVGTGGGGNTPPGAVNDNYDTNEDIALTVPVTGVLGNDTDADGNPLTVAAASTGTRNTAPTGSGSVTLNADGSFTYTPALNFNGAATFTYQAFDGAANSNTATVTINVAAVNDPPNFTSSPVTTATVGQAYTYDVNAVDPDGTTVTFLLVTSPTGMTINTASGLISWTPVAGQEGPQNVTVRATDNGTPLPAATADQSFTVTVQAAGAAAPLYFSLSDGSAVPGVAGPYDDADIYFWNGTTFSRFFDGSAAGLPAGADIDAFQVMADGSILMSFDANGGVNVPGVGLVQDEDIVRFVPPNTWSLFFDGSLVGLDAGVNNEDIDAFKLLADGRLVISTVGAVSVPGPGGTTVTGVGQDLLVFTPTVAGNYTAGTWAMYFDGSDVGLAAGSENIDGVSIGADGKIYLSTTGAFAVTGVSGTNQDVFVFTPTSLGPTTAGTFSPTLYFDGSAVGLTTGNVDEIQVP
jgi:hypothetical protein